MIVFFFIPLFMLLNTFALNSCQYSGLKFALDTELFKLLKSFPINTFAQNKTLTPKEGLNYDSAGLLSYHLHIDNLILLSIQNPSKVDVTGDKTTLQVHIENVQATFQTNYDIKIIEFIHDSGVNKTIKVTLNRIDGDFFFQNGQITFKKFEIEIGEIDINFSSAFFNVIYTIFKGLIVNKINKSVGSIHEVVQNALNQFISSPLVLDSGYGLKLNLTNVDHPELYSFDSTKAIKLPYLKRHF